MILQTAPSAARELSARVSQPAAPGAFASQEPLCLVWPTEIVNLA